MMGFTGIILTEALAGKSVLEVGGVSACMRTIQECVCVCITVLASPHCCRCMLFWLAVVICIPFWLPFLC